MADIDSTIKVLADRNAADYIRWLLGPSYQLIKTEGTELPATKRFADTVYHVKDEEGNPFILHIVKLWELDGDKLLREKMLGVYPLLGLTKLENPEKAFRQIVSEIHQIHDRTLSLDMLSVFSYYQV